MSAKFKNWIKDIQINNTVGAGWRVGLDGCDVFDDLNEYKVKTRRTLAIAENLKTKEDAKQIAIKWLEDQLEIVKALQTND